MKTYEEKVQTLEDEIKDLNEKLSAANAEINTKESLVKQHAKVAEEAVSGIHALMILLPTLKIFKLKVCLNINCLLFSWN